MPYGRNQSYGKGASRKRPYNSRGGSSAPQAPRDETWKTVYTKNIPMSGRGFINIKVSESSKGRQFMWIRRGFYTRDNREVYSQGGNPLALSIDLSDVDAIVRFVGEILINSGVPLQAVAEFIEAEGEYDEE